MIGLLILIVATIAGAIVPMAVIWKKTDNPFVLAGVGIFGGLAGAFIATQYL